MTYQATAVTITIDPDNLNGYTDSHIAALWHVAQANPVPHGDRDAGKLAEAIGYEIIRRFLRSTSPELYVHKSDDHYWHALTQHCTWNGTEWVRKDAADDVALNPASAAVIIYGPQGCGKTRNGAALAQHYGKTQIIDEWVSGQPLPDNALCLTSDGALDGVGTYRPPYSRSTSLVVPYSDAIKALGQGFNVSASAPAGEEESLPQPQQAHAWLAALPAWDGQGRLQQLIGSSNPAAGDVGPADTPLPPLPTPSLPRLN